MGDISTELFIMFASTHFVLSNILTAWITHILLIFSKILPYFVKYLIGYCHFYYQLGYGLIFYIYFYRRYKARKTKNWKTFYGNSVTNWFLFNTSIFIKFIFTKKFAVYVYTLFTLTKKSFVFLCSLSTSYLTTSKMKFKKLSKLINFKLNFIWTPIFKKTSYISILNSLKRFIWRN